MDRAQGRDSSYVTNDIGAIPSRLWHTWHLRCRTGATSFSKVTAGSAPASVRETLETEITNIVDISTVLNRDAVLVISISFSLTDNAVGCRSLFPSEESDRNSGGDQRESCHYDKILEVPSKPASGEYRSQAHYLIGCR